jgi:2-polyprenyl-3-methyl-5-hydroxy-6-metoxy-1,4-benzoquinol methylase
MYKFDDQTNPFRRQFFFSESDDYYVIRKHMRDFAESIIEYAKNSKTKLNVLEVGPSSNLYLESEASLTTAIIGTEIKKLGHTYKTLDIDGNADYICSIEEVSKHVTEKFDIVILLGIIEHVGNIHLLSNEFYNITNKEATIFINTPYMFKVHGPIPDYWRISQYGYEHLFGKQFDLSFDTFPPGELGKNSFPLSFNVTLTKK